MGLGRSQVQIDCAPSWIFNRMVQAYQARPAYPEPLIKALAELARPAGRRLGDVGAGIGHVALPLAQRGFDVLAIEPARAMLQQLETEACERGVKLDTLHAAAEALPLEPHSLDSAIVADALHFLDGRRAAAEVQRVLARRCALGVVTCEFSETPFMRAVDRLMQEAAPRRPRDVSGLVPQWFAVAGVELSQVQRFHDATQLDAARLESILRSISFIGPAMNAERFAAFRKRLHALPGPLVWARSFTLYGGRRRCRAGDRGERA